MIPILRSTLSLEIDGEMAKTMATFSSIIVCLMDVVEK